MSFCGCTYSRPFDWWDLHFSSWLWHHLYSSQNIQMIRTVYCHLQGLCLCFAWRVIVNWLKLYDFFVHSLFGDKTNKLILICWHIFLKLNCVPNSLEIWQFSFSKKNCLVKTLLQFLKVAHLEHFKARC